MFDMVFKNEDELDNWVMNNHYEISCKVVDALIDNYPFDEPILVMSWSVKEDGLIYDVECIPDDVIVTLEQNLETMEQNEDYERCAKIKQLIDGSTK